MFDNRLVDAATGEQLNTRLLISRWGNGLKLGHVDTVGHKHSLVINLLEQASLNLS